MTSYNIVIFSIFLMDKLFLRRSFWIRKERFSTWEFPTIICCFFVDEARDTSKALSASRSLAKAKESERIGTKVENKDENSEEDEETEEDEEGEDGEEDGEKDEDGEEEEESEEDEDEEDDEEEENGNSGRNLQTDR